MIDLKKANFLLFSSWLVAAALSASKVKAQESSTDEKLEFFERKVRPIFVEHCYNCHSQDHKEAGGLRVDDHRALLEGGNTGPAVVPSKSDQSVLIQRITHADDKKSMPPDARLTESQINDLKRWIDDGAVWPPLVVPGDIDQTLDGRQIHTELLTNHWAWQPLSNATVPRLQEPDSLADWPRTDIDHFIAAKWREHGVSPVRDAHRIELGRRLYYDLTGLPPTDEQLVEYLSDESENAYEKIVDRLLQSDQFAERWARHWLDLARYGESTGSARNLPYPHAWRYRDYVIDSFKKDKPYNRFLQEQVAGDLLPASSVAEKKEQLIATGFLALGVKDVNQRFTVRYDMDNVDEQIDMVSKAILGLTISCARCHDHKFDPISDEDFYALYGILRSTRTGMRVIDEPSIFSEHNEELFELQKKLCNLALDSWITECRNWEAEISAAGQWIRQNWKQGVAWETIEKSVPKNPWTIALTKSVSGSGNESLRQLARLLSTDDKDYPSAARMLSVELKENELEASRREQSGKMLFDLANSGMKDWQVDGAGLEKATIGDSTFLSVLGGIDRPFTLFLEPGFHTNRLSDRHAGVIRSPDFVVEHDEISILCRGSGNARARLVMENFQGDSLLFDTVNPSLNSNESQWITMSIRPQWKGLRAHIELLTRDFKPYIGIVKQPEVLDKSDGRSSFGILKVVAHPKGSRPTRDSVLPKTVISQCLESREGLIRAVVRSSVDALQRIRTETASSEDVRWINSLIQSDIISWSRSESEEIREGIKRYKELEATIPVPRLTPGVYDDQLAVDQEYLPRGDHKRAERVVSRRYLQVLESDQATYGRLGSGRLQLANEIVRTTNPLTARVYVNRVWNWLFGEGLVRSVDNFGRMGLQPDHPELLDLLAKEFMANGWSTKKLIRAMVLTQTWRRSVEPTPSALAKDSSNSLWSHALVRRIDAESIRDTMLKVSGALRRPDRGVGTGNYYRMVLEPNKQSPPGPLDGAGRRSLYLEVRRNFPNDFLLSFDFPRPVAPVGRRSTTIVPAQSLTLLNDPFVVSQAKRWAEKVMKEHADSQARVRAVYQTLLNREPNDEELKKAIQLIGEVKGSEDELAAWTAFTHSMFNVKEAIFLR